ncbi:MAG: hypothetical protein QW734_09420 [Candidatus Bathyarchaeia archaeon]
MSKKVEKGTTIGCDYEVEVRDKDGKLLDKRKGVSHTWVRIYTRFLRELFANVAGNTRSFSVIDTGGVVRSAYSATGGTPTYNVAFGARAPSNTDAYGIQVGSSDIPYSRDHYSLQAKITHGTGAGQLLYGEVTVEDVELEDTTERFRIVRAFTNSSGASVTVKEIGIVVVNQYSSSYYYFLFARDVLPSPISVPDGASLTVRYRIFVSYA